MRGFVSGVVSVVLVLTACTPEVDDVVQTPTSVQATEGVITVSDNAVVIYAEWLEPPTPALDRPIPEDEPPARIMPSSQPTRLHIAVNGGGCLPQVDLSLVELYPFVLDLVIREGVPEGGIQCSNILTTYGFEVRLSQKIDLETASLTVTSLPESAAP